MNNIDMPNLVSQVRAGDRRATNRLVELAEPMIFPIVLRRLRNWTEALDVTQDVVIQMLRKLNHLRDPERFEFWLRRIAVRMAINWATRRQNEFSRDGTALNDISCRGTDPLDRIVQAENADCLRRGLRSLRDMDRQLLIAYYFNDCSIEEMSVLYDCPVGTIKRRLHTARCRLRETLTELTFVG